MENFENVIRIYVHVKLRKFHRMPSAQLFWPACWLHNEYECGDETAAILANNYCIYTLKEEIAQLSLSLPVVWQVTGWPLASGGADLEG